jgi:hypothetical protein
MKLNIERWFEKFEYQLQIDFDNQTDFDSFRKFVDHQYTIYCDNYSQDLEDLEDLGNG